MRKPDPVRIGPDWIPHTAKLGQDWTRHDRSTPKTSQATPSSNGEIPSMARTTTSVSKVAIYGCRSMHMPWFSPRLDGSPCLHEHDPAAGSMVRSHLERS